jgi:hypothetical protein
LAKNIGWDDDGHDITDAIGDVDINATGSLQAQINKKINTTDLSDYVNGQLAGDIADWLNANVNPVGSAVIVDKTLSISGAAADSKIVGDIVTNINNNFNSLEEGEIQLTNGVLVKGYYPYDSKVNPHIGTSSYARMMVFPIKKGFTYLVTWLDGISAPRYRTALGNTPANELAADIPIYNYVDNANTSHTKYPVVNTGYDYLYVYIGNSASATADKCVVSLKLLDEFQENTNRVLDKLEEGKILLKSGVVVRGYYPLVNGTMGTNDSTRIAVFPVKKGATYLVTWLENISTPRYRTAFGNYSADEIVEGIPIYNYVDNINTSHVEYPVTNDNYNYLYVYIGQSADATIDKCIVAMELSEIGSFMASDGDLW